jgi:hypothetical protein
MSLIAEVVDMMAATKWSVDQLDRWLNLTWTIGRAGPLLTNPYRERVFNAQSSRYRIHCHDHPVRPYATTWLAYPNPAMGPKPNQPDAWTYLMSACVACLRLRADPWFTQNVDCVILTPEIDDPKLKRLLGVVFDRHVEYLECLHGRPPPGFPSTPIVRWNGVFNKLHIWNPDVYPYDRVLLMDAEVIVKDFKKYRGLFELPGDFLGVSESMEIPRNVGYREVPYEYSSYGSGEYACMNAGVLIARPNHQDFYSMKALLKGGWTYTSERRPEYRARPNEQMVMWCPEQEFLTCFFAGRSYHLGPKDEWFSLQDTCAHWTFDYKGEKIWACPLAYPHLSDLYIKLFGELFEKNPQFVTLPYIRSFLSGLGRKSDSLSSVGEVQWQSSGSQTIDSDITI